jgi:hypothetical protein
MLLRWRDAVASGLPGINGLAQFPFQRLRVVSAAVSGGERPQLRLKTFL